MDTRGLITCLGDLRHRRDLRQALEADRQSDADKLAHRFVLQDFEAAAYSRAGLIVEGVRLSNDDALQLIEAIESQ